MLARVRNLLELFFLRRYFYTLPPDALYYVHSESEAHVRHYTSRYGFRLVETVEIPGQVEKAFILEATGQELREKLGKTHNIPARGIQILNPEKS